MTSVALVMLGTFCSDSRSVAGLVAKIVIRSSRGVLSGKEMLSLGL